MWNNNSRTKRRRDLRFGRFCSYCYRLGDLYFRFYILPTQTEIFYDVWWCLKNQMRHYNSRTKRRRDLRFGPICTYCYHSGDLFFRINVLLTQTAIFYNVWWCLKNQIRHYNSKTKRRRDLRFGPFCSYCYRQDDLYFRFDILPAQTKIFYGVG